MQKEEGIINLGQFLGSGIPVDGIQNTGGGIGLSLEEGQRGERRNWVEMYTLILAVEVGIAFYS